MVIKGLEQVEWGGCFLLVLIYAGTEMMDGCSFWEMDLFVL